MSHFEVVYGINPIGLLDLVPKATKKLFSSDADKRIKEIKKLHEQVRVTIEKQNELYMKVANKYRKHVEFSVGDLV